jgi:hypothetical protein
VFRRLFWLAVGTGLGFGISFWVMRSIRGALDRYRPERVGSDLAGAVRAFGADLRAAAADGRAAMRDREVELRREIHKA